MDFWKIHIRKKRLASLEGWKSALTDKMYGKNLRKLAIFFFSRKFARYYILNSKINKEYMIEYFKIIDKFKHASLNPNLFTVEFFRIYNV